MDERVNGGSVDIKFEHDFHRVWFSLDADELFIECDGPNSAGEACWLPLDDARQLRDWLNKHVKD